MGLRLLLTGPFRQLLGVITISSGRIWGDEAVLRHLLSVSRVPWEYSRVYMCSVRIGGSELNTVGWSVGGPRVILTGSEVELHVGYPRTCR